MFLWEMTDDLDPISFVKNKITVSYKSNVNKIQPLLAEVSTFYHITRQDPAITPDGVN